MSTGSGETPLAIETRVLAVKDPSDPLAQTLARGLINLVIAEREYDRRHGTLFNRPAPDPENEVDRNRWAERLGLSGSLHEPRTDSSIPPFAILGAFAAHELVGMAVVRKPDNVKLCDPAQGRHTEVYLHNVFVVDQLRGRGVGRALLAATVDLLHPEDRITLDVGPHHLLARHFYERNGFVAAERPFDPSPFIASYETEPPTGMFTTAGALGQRLAGGHA